MAVCRASAHSSRPGLSAQHFYFPPLQPVVTEYQYKLPVARGGPAPHYLLLCSLTMIQSLVCTTSADPVCHLQRSHLLHLTYPISECTVSVQVCTGVQWHRLPNILPVSCIQTLTQVTSTVLIKIITIVTTVHQAVTQWRLLIQCLILTTAVLTEVRGADMIVESVWW